MTVISTNGSEPEHLPRIVEIIGVAGTGKSTLARALCLDNEQFKMGCTLNVRKAGHLPYLVRQMAHCFPFFRQIATHGRRLTRREMAKTIYLSGWHRELIQKHGNDPEIILLDQGPIYDMATLYAFGPDELRHARQATWWQKMANQWARTIHTVIWLRAPRALLLERINHRDQWHPVKGKSVPEMENYLSQYQTAFDFVMAQISAIGGVTVLELNTADRSPEEIMDQSIEALGLKQTG